MTEKTIEDLAAEVKAAHTKALDEHAKKVDEVKVIAEQAVAEAKKGMELSNSLKEKADLGLTEMNGLKSSLTGLTSQLTEIEQKLARRTGGRDAVEQKS